MWACGGMVDTLVLGTSAKAWEFESLHAQLLRKEPKGSFFNCAKKDENSTRRSLVSSSSGFADGRNEVSPDSEQILLTGAKYRKQNSESVEQIQDSLFTPNYKKKSRKALF